jgi:hypothetical protein
MGSGKEDNEERRSSSSGRFAGARARVHVKNLNGKAKRVLEALQANVNHNVDLINELTEDCLSEDADNSIGGYAKKMLVAYIACWSGACDLFHEVANTCLPGDPSELS